ncbi:MAG: gcvT [Evtepia sp.]|jgi:aminomethyltransferase|nr:gcvT [Evtepia sp.]
MEKKTPLYQTHVDLGGKMVPFAGYLMPVQYTDIIEEHLAVRKAAGLFDVSHMGEVLLTGVDAVKTLNMLCSNDFTDMLDGRVRYSPMLNPEGGVIDDLLVYRLDEKRYWMVINASNREKDVEWIGNHLIGNTKMEDISDEVAQIALQGPKSKEMMLQLAKLENIPQKYYTFVEKALVAGIPCLLSRTGYTGSYGYELYCSANNAQELWSKLMEAGKDFGLIPCGLGARDTLRLEASMPLYGHEMDDTVSPLETGLGFAVKMQKENFIGKDALLQKGEPRITRVGLKVTGRGIVREGCSVYIGEAEIGKTTSGTYLPYLKGGYAMALVQKESSMVGTAVMVMVRGRIIDAEIVSLPFFKE